MRDDDTKTACTRTVSAVKVKAQARLGVSMKAAMVDDSRRVSPPDSMPDAGVTRAELHGAAGS